MSKARWQEEFEVLVSNNGPYADGGGLKALAADLGVAPQTVYWWSQGAKAPSYENRRKLRRMAEENTP